MADYRECYAQIHAAGASVVAVSVDAPNKSQALRIDLSLPFPILCDTERRVVKDWGIFNSAEKGGIAEPAVFIINSSRVIRYAAVDTVATRVAAAEIVRVLQNGVEAMRVRRKVHLPLFSEWKSAIRNAFQRS